VPALGILLVIILFFVLIMLGMVLWRWSHRLKQENDQALVRQEEELEAGHRKALTTLEEGWIIDFADLKLVKALARGAFGEVWTAQWSMMPSSYVAVKKILSTPDDMMMEVKETPSKNKKNAATSSDMLSIFRDKEISLLMRTRHRRVCLFLGAGRTSDGNIFMVHEYVSGGDLRRVLDDSSVRLTTGRRLIIAKDVAEGMTFLHGRQLIHRDLKSLNVLINKSGRAKIADFGLSRFTAAKDREQLQNLSSLNFGSVENSELRSILNKDPEEVNVANDATEPGKTYKRSSGLITAGLQRIRSVGHADSASGNLPEKKESENSSVWQSMGKRHHGRSSESRGQSAQMTGNRGSILWMAPEILNFKGDTAVYGFSADVYSFGVVLYEIITRRAPWSNIRPPIMIGVINKLEAGERPALKTDKEKNHLLVPLMNICWSQNPDDRPSFSECLNAIAIMLEGVDRGDKSVKGVRKRTLDMESSSTAERSDKRPTFELGADSLSSSNELVENPFLNEDTTRRLQQEVELGFVGTSVGGSQSSHEDFK
jgi:serine/threonine protein kinase